jgi:hypothetical protein
LIANCGAERPQIEIFNLQFPSFLGLAAPAMLLYARFTVGARFARKAVLAAAARAHEARLRLVAK